MSLKTHSRKRVVAVCDLCGEVRELKYQQYRDLCVACAHKTPEFKEKLSDLLSGENHPNYGKTASKDVCEKISKALTGRVVSEVTGKKISKALSGRVRSKESRIKQSVSMSGKNNRLYNKHLETETRKKISATKQGIPYEEWEFFARDQLYCPDYNEKCRESNREKYGRRCFICGLPEDENKDINGRKRKLSVHHVDMNKDQGCDGIRWKLVPVCMNHHSHSKLWKSRIIYLLNNIYPQGCELDEI